MQRWSKSEVGRLKMILERERSGSVWEMARRAQLTIKRRSVSSIAHKIRELMAKEQFDVSEVEVGGCSFPAQVISGYIIITLQDGSMVPLHHYVWSSTYGEIPTGYHVHHRDNKPLNNELNNLELMEGGDHILHHHTGKPAETSMLFWFLQEKNLWQEYLSYRKNIIELVND